VTTGLGSASPKTSSFLTDPNTSYAQVLAQHDSDGEDARWVWEESLAPLTMTRGGRTFFYLADGQDSVRQLTDESGRVTDSYHYDAWGNPLAGGSGTTKNPFRYTGQQLDQDGKYFLRARYYNAGTGRFLSHDPEMGSQSDPISLHRYVYAGDDGVNHVDPSGREFSIAGAVTSLTVAGIISMAVHPTAANAPGENDTLVASSDNTGAIVGDVAIAALVEGAIAAYTARSAFSAVSQTLDATSTAFKWVHDEQLAKASVYKLIKEFTGSWGLFTPRIRVVMETTAVRTFGRYDPEFNTITLFKGADIITLAEELLHWKQCVARGLVGTPVSKIPGQVIREMEMEITDLAQEIGISIIKSVD